MQNSEEYGGTNQPEEIGGEEGAAQQLKSLTISVGVLSNYTVTRDELLRRGRDVFAGMRAGWLKLRIDRPLPLAQAAEAHQLLESRQTGGKTGPEDPLTGECSDSC